MNQLSLFDCKLKQGNSNIEFEDEMKKALEPHEWHSKSFLNWAYDEEERRVAATTTLDLKSIRKFDKKGKQKLFVQRTYHYSTIDEVIEDEIECKNLEEIKSILESEKSLIYFAYYNKVFFDGRRYWWKWREENGEVIFTEKFIPLMG